MIAKKPVSAKERVIRHVEFAAEFKETENLSPACVRLSYFQYYLLDIAIPGLILLALILLTPVFIAYRFLRKWITIVKVKQE